MEIAKMVDYGNAPEIFVDGRGRIELVNGGGSIRMSYYTTHVTNTGSENRLTVQLRWCRSAWLRDAALFSSPKGGEFIQAAELLSRIETGRHLTLVR